MKYSDYSSDNSKKIKKNVYGVIFCCIAFLAVIIRLSVNNKAKVKENKNSSIINSQSYNDKDTSKVSSQTENKVTSEPYSEPAPAASSTAKTPTKTETKAPTFVNAVEGAVIKGYSDTNLQFSKTFNDMRIHTGVDIAAKAGTKVKAVSQGKVISVENSLTTGKTVTVDHSGITVKYCGLAVINVSQNDAVNAGDTLGTLGEIPSECEDPSHLHLEVYRDGNVISPNEIMPK